MVDLAKFKIELEAILRQAEILQYSLAEDIGMSQTTFSKKLNNRNDKSFSHPEIRSIIKYLVKKRAITKHDTIIKLLEATECTFEDEIWEEYPLNILKPSTVPVLSHITTQAHYSATLELHYLGENVPRNDKFLLKPNKDNCFVIGRKEGNEKVIDLEISDRAVSRVQLKFLYLERLWFVIYYTEGTTFWRSGKKLTLQFSPYTKLDNDSNKKERLFHYDIIEFQKYKLKFLDIAQTEI